LLQVESGSMNKSNGSGSGGPKINGTDRILIPVKNILRNFSIFFILCEVEVGTGLVSGENIFGSSSLLNLSGYLVAILYVQEVLTHFI